MGGDVLSDSAQTRRGARTQRPAATRFHPRHIQRGRCHVGLCLIIVIVVIVVVAAAIVVVAAAVVVVMIQQTAGTSRQVSLAVPSGTTGSATQTSAGTSSLWAPDLAARHLVDPAHLLVQDALEALLVLLVLAGDRRPLTHAAAQLLDFGDRGGQVTNCHHLSAPLFSADH